MNPTPFKAKMDQDQFMAMGQALRESGRPLTEAYAIAETIHEAFFKQTRYENFESFKQQYYKLHPAKR